MIGLIFLAVVLCYIFLSKFIVAKVYEKTKSIKKKNMAIAIMILIPTWDVILGFPIYAYLCAFESGTKIYKTVDNVEGFYIGQKSISSEPIKPYDRYKYIDYKEVKNDKPTGKYYRSYWVDYFKNREIANMCIYPRYPQNLHRSYTQAFNGGRCIVKDEITAIEVSRWEYKEGIESIAFISFLGLSKSISEKIIDRKNGEVLSEIIEYPWNQGWLINSANHIIPLVVFHCKRKLVFNEGYINTLKPKKGED